MECPSWIRTVAVFEHVRNAFDLINLDYVALYNIDMQDNNDKK